jgi:hypothetical protein
VRVDRVGDEFRRRRFEGKNLAVGGQRLLEVTGDHDDELRPVVHVAAEPSRGATMQL